MYNTGSIISKDNYMESKFFKPIGQSLIEGSSINGPDAFVKPGSLPLRGTKDNKSGMDLKPSKPALGKPLPLRQSNPVAQAQPDREGIKLRQKKIEEATPPKSTAEESTTPQRRTTPPKTSTTPDTTTTPSTPNNTMPKKTWEKKPKQDKAPRDQAGGRKGDSPFFTSSTTTEPGADMKAFNVYDKAGDSGSFVVEGLSTSVSYIPKTASPSLLRPDVASGPLTLGENNPKLMINITTFAPAISENLTNTVPYYKTFLNLLFNRWTTDIMRITKGVVPSFWTLPNMTAMLVSVISALEYYFTLDSIIAFQNVGVSGMTGSRTLEIYGNSFNLPQILIARDNLRRYLQGTWCPPGLAMFIRGWFQYYRTSNIAGQANIFRYVSNDDFLKDVNNPTVLGANITATVEAFRVSLSVASVVQTMGLLSNTHPFGIINGLPKSSMDAAYNEDMVECFVNEPTIYCDTNAANAQCVTPISYASTINDISYYTMRNPSELNGYTFAMQCIPVTAASSGFSYATAANYYGIRRMSTYTPGAVGSTGNKFIYDASTNTFVTRSMFNLANMITGADVHMVFSVNSVTTQVNNAPLGWQRVYYDNQNAPSTLFNMLASTLYGTSI
jgi:hypothetical protein